MHALDKHYIILEEVREDDRVERSSLHDRQNVFDIFCKISCHNIVAFSSLMPTLV